MDTLTFVKRVARSTAILSVTTAAAIAIASRLETGSPATAINNVAHIIDGDDHEFPNNFQQRETLIGLAINSTAMAGWAVVHETLFGRMKRPVRTAGAVATAALAYVVDYHLVPRRLSPGIEKVLSRPSVAAAYAILAISLAASSASQTDE